MILFRGKREINGNFELVMERKDKGKMFEENISNDTCTLKTSKKTNQEF